MNEPMQSTGEALTVPERMIVAPSVGVFRPLAALAAEGDDLIEGQSIGVVEGPGTATPVRSPFAGRLAGMIAQPGQRLREGQPVAWLRVA
jgi:biotin carboxyl carrier protein